MGCWERLLKPLMKTSIMHSVIATAALVVAIPRAVGCRTNRQRWRTVARVRAARIAPLGLTRRGQGFGQGGVRQASSLAPLWRAVCTEPPRRNCAALPKIRPGRSRTRRAEDLFRPFTPSKGTKDEQAYFQLCNTGYHGFWVLKLAELSFALPHTNVGGSGSSWGAPKPFEPAEAPHVSSPLPNVYSSGRALSEADGSDGAAAVANGFGGGAQASTFASPAHCRRSSSCGSSVESRWVRSVEMAGSGVEAERGTAH